MTTTVMNRTTEEVFNHHMDAFLRKDLDDIISDFGENSIFINSFGTKAVGLEAIKTAYSELLQSIEEGTTFAVKQVIIERDIVFLEWTSDSPSSVVNDGLDTNVIRDGKIYAQTVKFSITPKTI